MIDTQTGELPPKMAKLVKVLLEIGMKEDDITVVNEEFLKVIRLGGGCIQSPAKVYFTRSGNYEYFDSGDRGGVD